MDRSAIEALALGKPEPPADLGIWDASDDTGQIEPRGWLLGNVFCRRTISALIAEGAAGKTALRTAQILSLATGRNLTGDYVFRRCRVLFILLEDDELELKRRIRAACILHGIEQSELKGWLFLSAPGRRGGKLMQLEQGRPEVGQMAGLIEEAVKERDIDLVVMDPFIKSHALEENRNDEIDEVMALMADIAAKHNIAIDTVHHVAKGLSDPGNANRGRGASAMKDAARLVYTLTTMSSEEASQFDVSEADRRFYIRMDPGKVNLAPSGKVRWFKLIGVPIGNGTDDYPSGDEVQTVVQWNPPDAWDGLTSSLLNRVLDDIQAGLENGSRYSSASAAGDRAAWKVVQLHAPDKSEKQAKRIIKEWEGTGLLFSSEYRDPISRKERKGLYVDSTKRPGTVVD